ncbi:inositol polyphosphate multikinase [Pieris brassicae]|uniref:inositol polyphosphate multikinase n=1 Tax=Pieris brassicae TaxID=7116 RepID=UPI001E65EFD0|nr:inositol polyphosphate multikinase [Pieris brassicae]XP_045522585.1 inositol polyphosphate multikinase [Pieris brassicae]XP_045522586.1 inositol polyphosphate multikinase [Pieris brassicae]
MSDVPQKTKERKPRRQRSIYQVHYSLPARTEMTAKPLSMPYESLEVQKYGRQVAGHTSTDVSTKYLGLLQCNNGTILKPILKESQKREVDFYTKLFSSNDKDLVELREFVPKYFGCKKFTYNGFEQEYIILEDLTERMLEPCIMDVKIGKQTWDPTASQEKIEREKSKYKKCKEEWGFCIPGYQVYRLDSGALLKYGKDYGKKLHGHVVTAAIKNYLNGLGGRLCRALILQFLSRLWALQRWCSRQTSLRLYSTSLLLAYDAAKLRSCCGETAAFEGKKEKCRPVPPTRRRSIHSLHSPLSGSNFSGLLSPTGPVYKTLSPSRLTISKPLSPPPVTSPWTEALDKLNHNHSFVHNYEEKLCKIKMNYRAVLDQLSQDSPTPNLWGTVKVIDFAHAFFGEDEERAVDDNFKEGVDSFVGIFEALLSETDDQVF